MGLCLRNLLALACASAAAADVEAGQRCPSYRTPVTALSDDCSLMQAASSLSGSEGITVFFNIYQRDVNLTRKIVDEQIQSLQKHFDIIDQVLYVTIDGTPELTYKCDKCRKQAHYSHGDEGVTLQLLFEHCAAGKSAKVSYIHSKGSFHSKGGKNDLFRRFLMQGALSESCLQMPLRCNICGSRFSPLPHYHIPGNMWVAKCDYVRKLIPPNHFTTAMDELVSSPNSSSFKWVQATRRVPSNFGTHRYAMEHWALSHPHALPCDVYRGGYYWGYEEIPKDWTPNLSHASQVQMTEFVEHSPRGGSVRAPLSDIWSWRLHEWMQLYHAVPKSGTWAQKLYEQEPAPVPAAKR